jgi:hypothetical protein
MTHRSTTGSRNAKRVVSALLVSAFLTVGSPVVATGSASSGGGAHNSVSATFGDCKNDNAGKHNGYNCPPPAPSTNNSGSGSDSGGVIYAN